MLGGMNVGLPVGLLLEALLVLLLVVSIIYCIVLDRRLRALRSGADGMRALIESLDGATRRAQAGIQELRGASEAAVQSLGKRTEDARILADELALMVEAGNNIAQRLEGGAATAQRTPARPETSVSERESWREAPDDGGRAAREPRSTGETVPLRRGTPEERRAGGDKSALLEALRNTR